MEKKNKIPQCPYCDADMVVRTSKRGPNAGKPFWGCPQFPSCRGVRAYTPGTQAPLTSDPPAAPTVLRRRRGTW